MLKKLIMSAAVFSIAGLTAHHIMLINLPGLIMDEARTKLSKQFGVKENEWVMAPSPEPDIRTIVRPSPDLSYAICMLDLSDGPVRLSVPTWDDYGSLAIFQRDTVNIFNGALRGGKKTLDVIAVHGNQLPDNPEEAQIVHLNSSEGIALVRRLAPDKDRYRLAAALADVSICKPQSTP